MRLLLQNKYALEGLRAAGLDAGKSALSQLIKRTLAMAETTEITEITETTELAAQPALPDHLSADPRSPHHLAAVFEHDVGIRLNGKELTNVEEYCISESWVKVPAGKTRDRKGNPLLIKLKGRVEAFYR